MKTLTNVDNGGDDWDKKVAGVGQNSLGK